MTARSNLSSDRARHSSLRIVAALYAGAIAVGAAVFFLVPGDPVLRALLADVLMTVLVWIASIGFRNASVYDPYWSVVPPFLLLFAIIDAGLMSFSAGILFVALTGWSVRLTGNWASLWTDFAAQDWRYDHFRAKAPRLWPLVSFFGIMLFPTLIVFAQLAAAIRFASVGGSVSSAAAGAAAILAGTVLQWLSDRQMASFRKRHPARTACIDEGLWRYSRHPNYFGEILVWAGVFLATAGVFPVGIHLLAPAAMAGMFLFVSIPLMEHRILASRPAYSEYRKRVSVLVPFFRRTTAKKAVERSE